MSGLDIDLRQPVEQAPEPGGPAWKRSLEWLREVLYSWGPPILVVLVIRSILCEPFQIPSGSMVPTLAIGDFILVSKFSYGLRIPFTEVEVLPLAEPKRGEIIVFIYPPSQSDDALCWLKAIPHTLSFGLIPGPECGIDYIKRIVGEPGDTIEVRDNLLFINGKEQTRRFDRADEAVRGGPRGPSPPRVAGRGPFVRRHQQLRADHGARRSLLRDGRQPGQLGGQPGVGLRAAGERAWEGRAGLALVQRL